MAGLPHILALSGGVGGAKLVEGLAANSCSLQVAVNTGDDFTHLGLHISPDIDTVLYSLAGIANRDTGWGIANETWSFMEQLSKLGEPDWFRLGDRDLATHVFRTRRLAEGASLSQVTADLAAALDVATPVFPATDGPLRTVVETPDEGDLAFQEYFVARQGTPEVSGLTYAGAGACSPSATLAAAAASPDLSGVVITPSNPWLSVEPILAIPGLRETLRSHPAPLVAISPIIAGAAVKGPAARIMATLGHEVSARGIARHYAGLIDGLIIDEQDAELAADIEDMGIRVMVANTLMRTLADKKSLAALTIQFCTELQQT